MTETEVEGFKSTSVFLMFCLTPDSDPSIQQVKQALFFTRQLVSLLVGTICGFYHLTGIAFLLGYILISMGFSHFYAFKFLKIDEEKADTTEVYMEAFPLSLAIFILSWTLSHTLFL